MEKFLNDQIIAQVKDVFNETLVHPVMILFFGSLSRCEYCSPTQQLLEEVSSLSDKLSLNLHDIEADPEIARQYQVDKTPGIVIASLEGEKITDYGVRFFGMPSGHEFTSLINSIIMVSQRSGGLDPESMKFLSSLDQNVLLQVFVTPT